jgi:hypothetical protein
LSVNSGFESSISRNAGAIDASKPKVRARLAANATSFCDNGRKVIWILKRARKEFVAGAPHADEVDLRFSNSCGDIEKLLAGALPCDLARKRSNLRR